MSEADGAVTPRKDRRICVNCHHARWKHLPDGTCLFDATVFVEGHFDFDRERSRTAPHEQACDTCGESYVHHREFGVCTEDACHRCGDTGQDPEHTGACGDCT